MKVLIDIDDLKKIIRPFVSYGSTSSQEIETKTDTIAMLVKVFGEEQADAISKVQS